MSVRVMSSHTHPGPAGRTLTARTRQAWARESHAAATVSGVMPAGRAMSRWSVAPVNRTRLRWATSTVCPSRRSASGVSAQASTSERARPGSCRRSVTYRLCRSASVRQDGP